MLRRFLGASICVAAVCLPGWAGPVEGPKTVQVRIDAAAPDASGAPTPGKRVFQVEYKGGERACVIAVGDHRPRVPMAVTVYDEKDTKVVEDQGTEQAPDYVCAIWYPPRTAKYTIIIYSVGKEYNDAFVTTR